MTKTCFQIYKKSSPILRRSGLFRVPFFLSFFLLFIVGKGFSQSNLNYEVNHPSVNSKQFNIEASIETALSKGQPSIVIPLLELQGKGYNLPISLMFYGGDVNCETEASTVGLGWSLMAGGCITVTVKGKEDSFITTSNDAPWQFQSNYLNSMFQIPTQRDVFVENMYTDLMPDEFKYSIPGHQGSLEMVLNSQNQYYQKLFPDESYKLEKTSSGYIITDDDGTKFYFEDCESKQSYSNNMPIVSSAWFLTRIETVKGGTFLFNYADETIIDVHDEFELNWYGCHHTKRITSIVSDFGSITFTADEGRRDRSAYDMLGNPLSTPSGRIKKIELKDETGTLIKGYELKNNSYFTNIIQDTRSRMGWSNYRMRLDSIVQYDASGNKLPPYVFTYSYRFNRAKSCYNQYPSVYGYNGKRGSWTEAPRSQALVDLYTSGTPACALINYHTPNEYLAGFSFVNDDYDETVNDYFNITSVRYPTGALDTFEYESHDYSQIARSELQSYILKTEGRRLKIKVSDDGSGNYQAITITEYKYRKHDSNYSLTEERSGVLTSPAFHSATLYKWGRLFDGSMGYVANRISSDRPLNNYQGQPVFYKEVEEVIKDINGSTIKRIIHYMMDDYIEPPLNYVYIRNHSGTDQDHLTIIPNIIYGKRNGYTLYISDYNNQYFSYIAYPLGEFCSLSQDGGRPAKEILIDGNGRIMAKKEYTYSPTVNNTRYGYVFIKENLSSGSGNNSDISVYNISRSSHPVNRSLVSRISETVYDYRDGHCDSTVTETSYEYSLGRTDNIRTRRQSEVTQIKYYYPDYINVSTGVSLSPEARAVRALQQKNMIGKPIQTIKSYNNIATEGHYCDFMILSEGIVVPKAYYNLSLDHAYVSGPSMSNGTIIKNSGFYLQEEALSYDADINPIRVNSRTSPTKVYVWGYGGRYPIAIIENYTEAQLNANNQLLSLLSQLKDYRKISNQTVCATLKCLNMNIRHNLPEGTLVRTYTYDPYSGLTSEFDYSGVGTIYTYDGFGRLASQHDDHFNLLENYIYHYKQ